jgi:hypothetical protein
LGRRLEKASFRRRAADRVALYRLPANSGWTRISHATLSSGAGERFGE